MNIQVCEPCIGQEEIDNVVACLKSGRISGYSGKYIDELEQALADYCGVEYGIAVSNCGVATLVTLEALGIGKGDEVIAPAFTMIAPHFAIVRAGAKPVLVDCENQTWNMNHNLIEKKITPKTKAILIAHVYGHPAPLKEIMVIASQHHLPVIEDAAEVLGAEYMGEKVGCFGKAGNLSLYCNKTITAGEGGMILTNDKELADKARLIKSYATDPANRFTHEIMGFNFRMSNVQAAIGCAQVKKLEAFTAKKRYIAQRYTEGLKDIKELTLPVELSYAKHCYWVYGLLCEGRLKRDEVIHKLGEAGIETRAFFNPMNRQPVFRKMGLFKDEKYPVSEYISQKGLYLPNGVALTDNQIDYIIEKVREVCA